MKFLFSVFLTMFAAIITPLAGQAPPDFILLNGKIITTVPHETLPATTSVLTIVGGRIVHDAKVVR
jgi:hypothetical protein